METPAERMIRERLESDNALRANPVLASARVMNIEGHEWKCYRIGIGRVQWRSGDNLAAGRRGGLNTYYAEVGLERLPSRFRSLEAAMKAAIAKLEPIARMTAVRKRKWDRLWREIMSRTTISEPAAKHAALIALDMLLPEKE